MKKNGTVLATLGQMKDLISLLIQAIPSNLSKDDAQMLIGRKGKLINAIRQAFKDILGANGYEEILEQWIRFYQEVFGVTVDFSDLDIPGAKDGFNWLVVMLESLTPNKLFAKCKERFSCRRYTEDLDTVQSKRIAKKTYAIWLRDRIEADEENKNKSADDCDKEGLNGITLEERLLLELFYHWRTGKHLDIENWTLCSGSRYSLGFVPDVRFCSDGVCVYYCTPGSYGESLRARAAVSLAA
jgi:hypothetical protein